MTAPTHKKCAAAGWRVDLDTGDEPTWCIDMAAVRRLLLDHALANADFEAARALLGEMSEVAA